jgi:CubicO group peptidase (beta-lactamase class C family)
MPFELLKRRIASTAVCVALLSIAPQAAFAAGKIARIDETSSEAAEPAPAAGFLDIALLHYAENGGRGSFADLSSLTATVTLRAVNNGKVATGPVFVSVTDVHSLLKQTTPAQTIDALKPGESSGPITIQLGATMPPSKSSAGGTPQFTDWKGAYDSLCGVDLMAVMVSAGPQSASPANDRKQEYLYLGYGSSKPWEEGHPVPMANICDDTQCVSIHRVARSIYKMIGCKVVGYAFFVGDGLDASRRIFGGFGEARTSLTPPETWFAPSTKMQIASSSKVLTALAGIRVLGARLDEPAYSYFPSDWRMPPTSIVKNITFRQFLSQTSGVQQYYTSSLYATADALEEFFTQPLPNPDAPKSCPGSHANPRNIPNPIVSDHTPCYSNTNFGIMRLALPRAGGAKTNNPAELAEGYVREVQDNVFAPVGVQNVGCRPPASPRDRALLYRYPGDSVSHDWGDTTLACGDWGWYVSVEDYAKVLLSLNSGDHRILTDCQFFDMETNPVSHPIGWDVKNDGPTRRWLEKNGEEGYGGATQTTSVGIYGGRSGCTGSGTSPVPGVAGVLFINSDIAGQPNFGAWTILTRAFRSAVTAKP